MKRKIALTLAALLFSGAVLAADRQGNSKKHRGSDAAEARHEDEDGDSRTAAAVSWGTHDIEVVRRYYAPKRRDLPPGLEKKYARTGQLPPGWQKKMQPLPASVEHECAPLPSGYRRGVIEGHAVIYNSRGTIIDVAVVF
jgi:hypothetical protein